MANKISPFAVDLLKQYLPKVQSDETRVGAQKANTTPAELANLQSQAKKAGEIGKRQKAMLLNARKTTEDKSVPFTFPNGETKTWDKMSEDERDFVHGQSLRTKGRLNENPNKESVFDAYVNPLNFLGNLAANAAESNYTAKQTKSNMPYLAAYGLPLALGALGNLGKAKPVSVPEIEAEVAEQSIEKPIKKAIEKPIQKAIEKPIEKVVENEAVQEIEKPAEKTLSKSTITKLNTKKAFEEAVNSNYNPELHDITKEQFAKVIKNRRNHYNKQVDPFKYEKEFQEEFADHMKTDPEYRVGDLEYEKDLNIYSHLKDDKELPSTDSGADKLYFEEPGIKERAKKIEKILSEKKSNYTGKEKALIRAFSRGYDKKLNYRNFVDYNRPANEKLYEKLRDEFENVITKSKLKEPLEVKRGDMDFNLKHVWRNGEKLPEGSVKYTELEPGDEWMPDKFTSTSISPTIDKAQTFGNVKSIIDLPKGQSVGVPNIFKNPEFAREEELILPNKLRYKVEQNNLKEKLIKDLKSAPKELVDMVKKTNEASFYDALSDKQKLDLINEYIMNVTDRHLKHKIVNPYVTAPAIPMFYKYLSTLNKKQKS